MTLSETLHHILHLSLRWVRHEKSRQNTQETLYESPASISTPLGVSSPYRRVDANVRLEDGIARARERQYVGRKCKRLDEHT